MIPGSIRWRLPLSYATIALLAVLFLGVVLLITLRGYYQQQELNYLNNNAQAIGSIMAEMAKADYPQKVLDSQIKALAFLSQTRVRWLNADDQLLADSGALQDSQRVSLVTGLFQTSSKMSSEEAGGETSEKMGVVIMTDASPENNVATSSLTVTQINGPIEETPGEPSIFSVLTVGTLYGFGLNARAPADSSRSNQRVHQPVYDQAGGLLGYVELSDGPAYGRKIVASVV